MRVLIILVVTVILSFSVFGKERCNSTKKDGKIMKLTKDTFKVLKRIESDSTRKERKKIRAAIKKVNPKAKITSEGDRSKNLKSKAHDRGAVDFTSKDMKKDAKNVSKELGKGYGTIHEDPIK